MNCFIFWIYGQKADRLFKKNRIIIFFKKSFFDYFVVIHLLDNNYNICARQWSMLNDELLFRLKNPSLLELGIFVAHLDQFPADTWFLKKANIDVRSFDWDAWERAKEQDASNQREGRELERGM